MLKQIFISFFILFLSQLSLADQAKPNQDKIVAKVNGKPIYESQVREKISKFLEFNGMSKDDRFSYENLSPEMRNEIIKNVILSDLVLKQAQEAKVDQDPEFKKSLEFTSGQLMQKFYLEKMINASITEDKIAAEYNKYVESQSNIEEYKVAHILVKTEEEAKDIKKKLDGGADFAKLAQEYSLDNNKDKGGELDFFVKGQMVAPFEQATENLKIGEISNPVKTDFGYHIIKLIDKRKIKVQSLAEMHDKIEDDLSVKYIQDYINKLEQDNKVEFL